MCQCPTGFSGKRCERDGCDNFCQNGGKVLPEYLFIQTISGYASYSNLSVLKHFGVDYAESNDTILNLKFSTIVMFGEQAVTHIS